jgi:hypothetical protein
LRRPHGRTSRARGDPLHGSHGDGAGRTRHRRDGLAASGAALQRMARIQGTRLSRAGRGTNRALGLTRETGRRTNQALGLTREAGRRTNRPRGLQLIARAHLRARCHGTGSARAARKIDRGPSGTRGAVLPPHCRDRLASVKSCVAGTGSTRLARTSHGANRSVRDGCVASLTTHRHDRLGLTRAMWHRRSKIRTTRFARTVHGPNQSIRDTRLASLTTHRGDRLGLTRAMWHRRSKIRTTRFARTVHGPNRSIRDTRLASLATHRGDRLRVTRVVTRRRMKIRTTRFARTGHETHPTIMETPRTGLATHRRDRLAITPDVTSSRTAAGITRLARTSDGSRLDRVARGARRIGDLPLGGCGAHGVCRFAARWRVRDGPRLTRRCFPSRTDAGFRARRWRPRSQT